MSEQRQKSRSLSEWQALISEQQESGETQMGFCRSRGISFHALRNAMSRVKHMNSRAESTPVPARFVDVTAARVLPAAALPPLAEPPPARRFTSELIFPNGVILRIAEV